MIFELIKKNMEKLFEDSLNNFFYRTKWMKDWHQIELEKNKKTHRALIWTSCYRISYCLSIEHYFYNTKPFDTWRIRWINKKSGIGTDSSRKLKNQAALRWIQLKDLKILSWLTTSEPTRKE